MLLITVCKYLLTNYQQIERLYKEFNFEVINNIMYFLFYTNFDLLFLSATKKRKCIGRNSSPVADFSILVPTLFLRLLFRQKTLTPLGYSRQKERPHDPMGTAGAALTNMAFRVTLRKSLFIPTHSGTPWMKGNTNLQH